MKDYAKYDALGLAELVRTGQVKAEEVLDAALTRAEAAQKELNCFANLFPEIAREQIKQGLPNGPFMGAPYPTKDLGVAIKGAPLTSGSRGWKDYVATENSVITERYRAAGLTLFGATTSPEFGLTTSTESALFGETLGIPGTRSAPPVVRPAARAQPSQRASFLWRKPQMVAGQFGFRRRVRACLVSNPRVVASRWGLAKLKTGSDCRLCMPSPARCVTAPR